jgi:membrane-associated protein
VSTGLAVVGALLAFAESLLGVGILLPGEIMISGLAATADPDQTPVLALAVILGAGLGDQLNYWLARAWGPRLSTSRLVRWVGPAHWDRGIVLVQRHGALAVLVSRLLPVVRTVVPAVAGVARLSPARFALASVTGSLLWTTLWVGAGSLAAGLLRWSLLPLLILLPGAVLILLLRRRRTRPQPRKRPTHLPSPVSQPIPSPTPRSPG